MAEALLSHGPADAAEHILLVAPLFAEANRMRRTLVMVMRALAARGIASHLPDLPGQNDSLVPLAAVSLTDWRVALAGVAAALPAPPLIASVRGGALIDDLRGGALIDGDVTARGWWRLAPLDGSAVLRHLSRTQAISDREAGVSPPAPPPDAPQQLAGYLLSAAMRADLAAATPAACAPLRTVTLGTSGGTAMPATIPGTPLWLRAEPGEDAAMTTAIADDLAAWSRQCAKP